MDGGSIRDADVPARLGTLLSTVFIDNGNEVDGDNVLRNVAVVTAVSGALLDGDDDPENSTLAAIVQEYRYREHWPTDTTLCGGALVAALSSQHVQPAYEAKMRKFVATYREEKERCARAAVEAAGREAEMKRIMKLEEHKQQLREKLVKRHRSKMTMASLVKSVMAQELPSYMPLTCDHCQVMDNAPQVFEVRPVTYNVMSDEAEDDLQRFLSQGAAAASREMFGDSSNSVAPVRTADIVYPVTLGLPDEETIDARLWQILGSVEFEKDGATREEQAAALAAHFQSRVGVPPWAEYFFRKKRDEQLLVQRQQAYQQAVNKRLVQLQSTTAATKLEIAAIEKALSVRDPVEHAQQVEEALRKIRKESVSLNATHTQQREDIQNIGKFVNRYTEKITMEVEDSRRCMQLLMKLQQIAQEKAPSDIVSKDAVASLVLPILNRFPSLALTEAHELEDDKGVDVDDDPLAHECPDCLLLKNSTPYCIVSGRRHQVHMPVDARAIQRELEEEQAAMAKSQSKLWDQASPTGTSASGGESEASSSGSSTTSASDADSTVSATSSDARSSDSSYTMERRVRRRRRRERQQRRRVEEAAKTEANKDLRDVDAVAKAVVAGNKALKKRLKNVRSKFLDGNKNAGGGAQRGRGAGRDSVANPGASNAAHATSEQIIADIDALLVQRSEGVTTEIQLSSQDDPLAQHCREFMDAAANRALGAMRNSAHRGLDEAAASSAAPLKAALHDQEAQFCEWYSLTLLRNNMDNKDLARANAPNSKNRGGDVGISKAAQTEAAIRGLKKELRNLHYSFQKRPKGRSAGATLDDAGFVALIIRITELERRNLFLRTRMKYAVSEKHTFENKLAALKGEYNIARINDKVAGLDTNGGDFDGLSSGDDAHVSEAVKGV